MTEDDPNWEYLCEDVLQFTDEVRGYLVDVGWYPGCDPSGSYQLLLLKGQDWDNPLLEFSTRDKDELVAKLESVLLRPQQP